MKKKIVFLIFALFLICFSSTAKAMTSEESTGVDSGGLHTYAQRFDDLSGGLTVTTTAVNNSGIMEAYISTTVLCMNESRNFRLRVYDSDEKKFIEVENENGIGSASRQFKVRTNMDTKETLWTVYVTDMTAETFYAQISLFYIYDEDARWIPPDWEEEETISKEEHEKEKRRLIILAWTWSVQIITGSIIAIFLAKKLANRFYGCG